MGIIIDGCGGLSVLSSKTFFILGVGMLAVWRGRQAASVVAVSVGQVNPFTLPRAVALALPRGVRNNNAGNLNRPTSYRWKGQVRPEHEKDERFAEFYEPKYGLRALGRDLSNKYRRGINTLSHLVSVYAPAADNNNETAYAIALSKALGVGIQTPFNFEQNLFALMKGIIKHENGINPYSDQQINEAIAIIWT